MELKVIYLLSGVVGATVLATLPVSQAILVLHPQASISSPQVPHRDNTMPSLPGNLALSEAQKEQITKLNWGINFQIDKILSVEQQKEFKNALDRGLHISSALKVISISQKQRHEILNVFNSAEEQIEKILTPEQLDYIDRQQKNQFNNIQPNNSKLKREVKYILCHPPAYLSIHSLNHPLGNLTLVI